MLIAVYWVGFELLNMIVDGITDCLDARTRLLTTLRTSKWKEAWGAFFGGSDTTAIYLCTALYHILRNPDVYNTLQDEIGTATAGGRLSSSHITYKEASQTPYLQACIMEAAPPPQGCATCGELVPDGSKVGVNPSVTPWDTGVFG